MRDFEEFYRREYPSVYRAAYLFSADRDVALDATQEAFKRAFARWRRLGRQEWAGGWVMTTALNECRRASHRSSRHRSAPEPQPETHAGAADSWVEALDVARWLTALPKRQRTAIVLYYLGDLPLPVVADFMGISEGTAKAHLAQGRAALRRRLEPEDVR